MTAATPTRGCDRPVTVTLTCDQAVTLAAVAIVTARRGDGLDDNSRLALLDGAAHIEAARLRSHRTGSTATRESSP